MAFTVQNDDGDVVNANAYIDVAYFNTYFGDRGIDVSDFDEDQIKGAIVSATEYIDLKDYKGEPLTDDQTTKFPREDLLDRYGNEVEGLPTNLKAATAQYARQACLKGGELAAAPDLNAQRITGFKEKIGPIEEETTYSSDTYIPTFQPYPIADALLSSYLDKGSFFSVYRA